MVMMYRHQTDEAEGHMPFKGLPPLTLAESAQLSRRGFDAANHNCIHMCSVLLSKVQKDRKIKHLWPQRAYILIGEDTPLNLGKYYSFFNTNNS